MGLGVSCGVRLLLVATAAAERKQQKALCRLGFRASATRKLRLGAVPDVRVLGVGPLDWLRSSSGWGGRGPGLAFRFRFPFLEVAYFVGVGPGSSAFRGSVWAIGFGDCVHCQGGVSASGVGLRVFFAGLGFGFVRSLWFPRENGFVALALELQFRPCVDWVAGFRFGIILGFTRLDGCTSSGFACPFGVEFNPFGFVV